MTCLGIPKPAREQDVIFEIARLSQSWTKDVSRLLPEERVAIVGTSEKRLREFVAGRVLSRSLFARLGILIQPVQQNSDRSPVWPSDIVGSITHCDDICVVAMGLSSKVSALGIDIEHRRELEQELWNYVCSTDEVETLPSNMSLGERVCWAFSAKEAFFKAQFPQTGRMLSFRDVNVIMNERAETFQVHLNNDLNEILSAIVNGSGRLWRGKAHLAAIWQTNV